MKAIIDPHTHTIASGHFTNDKILDLINTASKIGLEMLAITDHNPAIIVSAKESYFCSLKFLPKKRQGVEILYGVEADVLSECGKLGISNKALKDLDLVIASHHPPCFKPCGDEEKNTNSLINAIKSGVVDIIGHPDDEKYPLDYKKLAYECKRHGVLLEINNASLTPNGYRGNAKEKDLELLKICKEIQAPVIMGSDSHGKENVGNFTYAEKLLKEVDFPDKYVANYNRVLLMNVLEKHKKIRKNLN